MECTKSSMADYCIHNGEHTASAVKKALKEWGVFLGRELVVPVMLSWIMSHGGMRDLFLHWPIRRKRHCSGQCGCDKSVQYLPNVDTCIYSVNEEYSCPIWISDQTHLGCSAIAWAVILWAKELWNIGNIFALKKLSEEFYCYPESSIKMTLEIYSFY